MRSLLRFLALFLSLGLVFVAQAANPRPQFRPAVLGSGAESLVNRIDTKELVKQGQKDGAVMFCAVVSKTGAATSAWTYRGMPGTGALEAELNKKLQGMKFTPPIYNYQPVDVILFGTAIFSAASPVHLRIFLNQDPDQLKEGNDFIAPQPVIGGDSKFDGLTPPPEGIPVAVTAVVDLNLKVSREGQLQDLHVTAEDPPLLGFADAALSDFRDAKFIPAFNLGDPTDCNIVQSICYKPVD